MKCPNCGFENHIDNAEFCPICGCESTFKKAGYFDKQ